MFLYIVLKDDIKWLTILNYLISYYGLVKYSIDLIYCYIIEFGVVGISGTGIC